jgi:hypothetical protein
LARALVVPTLKLSTDSEVYARALRAIGQDLADLFPELLEVEVTGDRFAVRCQARDKGQYSGRSGATTPATKGWKNLLCRKGVADPVGASSLVPFARSYTAEDINRLEEGGALHRRSSEDKPDLYSLSERLRMIGRIIDANGGKLIKLSKDRNTVTFDYQDKSGETHRQELSNLSLYKLQQQYYSQRSLALKDPWSWADRFK